MRLTTRLLIGACLTVGVLAAFVAVTAETRMRHVFDAAIADELARSARLVAAEWHTGAEPAVLAARASLALAAHVTIVDLSGAPLADSDHRPATPLSRVSLASRPEISIALAAGTGVNERSDSVGAPPRILLLLANSTGKGVSTFLVTLRVKDAALSSTPPTCADTNGAPTHAVFQSQHTRLTNPLGWHNIALDWIPPFGALPRH